MPSSRFPVPRARVLLADDSVHVLEHVSDVVKTEFDVVAIVRDGAAAVATALELLPDLVISDLSMPGMNGFEVAARLRALNHPALVVILTMHQDDHFVRAARRNGAVGYVLKHRLHRDLMLALRLALQGQQFESSADSDSCG